MKVYSNWNSISLQAIKSAIERLNRVSAGRWDFSENTKQIQSNYDASCAYFEVKLQEDILLFSIFFNRKDISDISKCFIGYSFFVSEKMTGKEELLIGELANIILNSLISALCNKLNIKLIPSIPKVIQVEKEIGIEIISSSLPLAKEKTVFSNVISLKCGEKDVFCEVYSFFSKKIIDELEK